MKKVKIYYISNKIAPTQPVYIGITSRDLKTRLSEHIRNNNFGKFKNWINTQIKNNIDILISEIETVSKKETNSGYIKDIKKTNIILNPPPKWLFPPKPAMADEPQKKFHLLVGWGAVI